MTELETIKVVDTNRNTNLETDVEPGVRMVQFRWTGVRPLLMCNVRGVDPDDPKVIEHKELSGKRAKDLTPELRAEIARLEWEISAYWDAKLGFYVPAENIEKCLREGAAKARKGKKLEATAWVSGAGIIPLKDQPFKNLDKAYAQKDYKLRCSVRLPPGRGARVMKTRCMIPTGWVLEFVVEYHKSLDRKTLELAANEAGQFVGLCDHRPKFGRFLSEIIGVDRI